MKKLKALKFPYRVERLTIESTAELVKVASFNNKSTPIIALKVSDNLKKEVVLPVLLPKQKGQKYNLDKLKSKVLGVYETLKNTERKIYDLFPFISPFLPKNIVFIRREELIEKYPDLSPKVREDEAAKQYGAVFIIGKKVSSLDGKEQKSQNCIGCFSQDVDQEGLNGYIIVWNPTLNESFELSPDMDICF